MSSTLTESRPSAPGTPEPDRSAQFTGRAAQTSMRGRWRVSLRYARRQVLRAKGRSILILVMVMLPVAAGSLLATITASGSLTKETFLAQEVGPGASARITYVGAGTVVQDWSGRDWMIDDEASGDGANADDAEEAEAAPVESAPPLTDAESSLLTALPDGARLTRVIRTDQSATAGTRSVNLSVTQTDVSADAARELYAVQEGTLPSGVDGIALSAQTAKDLRVSVGDEVTITEAGWATAARRSGTHAQDSAIPATPTALTVTGILSPVPGSRGLYPAAGVTAEGALSDAADAFARTTSGLVTASWLASGTVVDWDSVSSINREGSIVTSRNVNEQQASTSFPADSDWRAENERTETLYVFAVLLIGLVQAVLMAGPAFAASAKRSERDLLQLSTNGGDRKTMTLATLSGGLVIGAAASAIGLVLGAVAVRVWSQISPTIIPNYVLPWGRLALVGLVGVLIAVVAAWLPARAASKAITRGGPRDLALPRFSISTMNWLGLLLAAVGAAATITGAALSQKPLVLAGIVSLEVGLVLAVGIFIGVFASLARKLPLTWRYAARDAARHRARTVPAIAAIVAATAGMTGTAMYTAADSQFRDAIYASAFTDTVISVMVGNQAEALSDAELADARGVVRAAFPSADDGIPLAFTGDEQHSIDAWPTAAGDAADATEAIWGFKVYPADQWDVFTPLPSGVLVTEDPTVVQMLGVPEADRVSAALARGELVLPAEFVTADGQATLEWYAEARDGSDTSADDQDDFDSPPPTSLPATAIPGRWPASASAIMPTSMAESLGFATQTRALLFDLGAVPSTADLTSLTATLNAGQGDSIRFNLAYDPGSAGQNSSSVDMGWVLMLITGALVLISAWISTALAIAESRPDLATMSAVGAPPRIRRKIAAAQAGFISCTGLLLGVAGGLALGTGLILMERAAGRDWDFTVPWL